MCEVCLFIYIRPKVSYLVPTKVRMRFEKCYENK